MKTPFSLLAALALSACAGSETGNGQRVHEKHLIQVTLGLTNGGDSLVMVDRDGARFAIDTAYLFATRLDFELGERCAGLEDVVVPYEGSCEDSRVRVDGPWIIDLLSGEFEPMFDGVTVLTGDFDAIDVKLAPGAAGAVDMEAGEPLDGATLVVTGTHAGAPFSITSRIDAHARFGRGHIAADSHVVGLSLDVHDWFRGLTLGSCIVAGDVPEVDGVLQLHNADKPACGNVEQAVRQGLGRVGQTRIN